MNRINVMLIVLVHYIVVTDGGDTNQKYKVILESATECRKPIPPYAKKRSLISKFIITKSKNTTFLSVRCTILAEVFFLNFSIRSYSVDRFGKEDLQFNIENLSCRSWLGKSYLVIGHLSYSKKDCRIQRGSFGTGDIDINKIFHSFPNWHAVGKILHRVTLVYNGSTKFCQELVTSVQ